MREPCVPAGGRGASERCSLLPDRGTRFWLLLGARALSRRRSSGVPREEGGQDLGLLLRTFALKKQLGEWGSGRAQLRLASLGFVLTAMPNWPDYAARVRCTFNGEVTWLGKLTGFSFFFPL